MKKNELIYLTYEVRCCLVFGSLVARKQESQLFLSAVALVVPKRGNKNKILCVSHQINPWFITGFSDGEGCFHLSITKNQELKIGWRVRIFFWNWTSLSGWRSFKADSNLFKRCRLN